MLWVIGCAKGLNGIVLAWRAIWWLKHQHIVDQMLGVEDLQDDLFEHLAVAILADEEVKKYCIEQRNGKINAIGGDTLVSLELKLGFIQK